MNCVHSSESEVTNCQLLWQFLLYSAVFAYNETLFGVEKNRLHILYVFVCVLYLCKPDK